MILASFAEILSLGAVLPFLAVLTAPDRIFRHPEAQPFIKALALTSPDQLLLPLTIGFALAALIAGAMRLMLLWASTSLSFATGADLSINIYRRTLYQPFEVHIARNSSEVINGISTKINVVIFNIIFPVVTLISSIILLTGILLTLLSVNPVVAVSAFTGFGLIYAVIIKITHKRQVTNSRQIAQESTNVIRSLQEGLGGIRDILIDGNQGVYCNIHHNAELIMRHAQGSSVFISDSPRFGMETLGLVLIASLAYLLMQQPDGLAKAIPVLGTLALGAQRVLPVMQQAYGAVSKIQSGQASLQDVLALLEQRIPEYAGQSVAEPIPFHERIALRNLSFRYTRQSPWVLKDIELSIAKGSRIGFIGRTGSGKSTLIDIVMGLLQPTDGRLEIDGRVVSTSNQRAWQAHIAHVPQSIFLADSTIEENIAFGVEKERIDHDRVRFVARQAQIADVIEEWPKKYDTYVGERGVRLSGGQRQRIGIARALYKQTDVIIFDEATSALDTDTESAVMQAIEDMDRNITILIIAHRLTTLKNCDQIVRLRDGHVEHIDNQAEISYDHNTLVEM
ncbi:MAG: ABC transporter ATP-binding protein [Chlorobiaceae bacterium]|nr:ABC transporter ATP-binding protein [Chlorobiaceae bacterium]